MFSLDTNYRNNLTLLSSEFSSLLICYDLSGLVCSLDFALIEKRNLHIQRLNQDFEKRNTFLWISWMKKVKIGYRTTQGRNRPLGAEWKPHQEAGSVCKVIWASWLIQPASQALRPYWNIGILFNKKYEFQFEKQFKLIWENELVFSFSIHAKILAVVPWLRKNLL